MSPIYYHVYDTNNSSKSSLKSVKLKCSLLKVFFRQSKQQMSLALDVSVQLWTLKLFMILQHIVRLKSYCTLVFCIWRSVVVMIPYKLMLRSGAAPSARWPAHCRCCTLNVTLTCALRSQASFFGKDC